MEGIVVTRLLHAGCGGSPLPAWITCEQEVRLDIDAQYHPDVLASITDIGNIDEVDAVYCSHTLEHLYPYDVVKALSEFRRVLKGGGTAYVFVPDLEDVKATDDVIMQTPEGPVSGLDLIYGYRPRLKEMPHMAHHFGFVKETLEDALLKAGFSAVGVSRISSFNLMGVGVK